MEVALVGEQEPAEDWDIWFNRFNNLLSNCLNIMPVSEVSGNPLGNQFLGVHVPVPQVDDI